ncbi:DUF3263 domain-containing protein [Nocardioides sp.]|uniref:DUF3263 domain-containing protein n=1 Tax=Nocardioides sp. TaxID=35761 RepID=UPI00351615AF
MPLTETEIAVLAFERTWWKYAGIKESMIRETFDWSAARYYAVLNALIDRPEAVEHDPMTVRRLQRLRDQRRAARGRRPAASAAPP